VSARSSTPTAGFLREVFLIVFARVAAFIVTGRLRDGGA
jgi:hypothetical protein